MDPGSAAHHAASATRCAASGERGLHDKKKARLSGPCKRAVGRSRSGGLAVDLGEIVLRGLGTFGDELAEIFGGGFRPRDEKFATRTDHLRLDLGGFAQRLGGS